MRHYEAIVIFSPQLTGESLNESKQNFDEQVRKLGGKVLLKTELGRRGFGYSIKKQREGLYVLIEFELEPSKIDELKRIVSLREEILRSTLMVAKPARKATQAVQNNS